MSGLEIYETLKGAMNEDERFRIIARAIDQKNDHLVTGKDLDLALAKFSKETSEEFKKISGEIKDAKTDVLKWFITAWAVNTLALIGFLFKMH